MQEPNDDAVSRRTFLKAGVASAAAAGIAIDAWAEEAATGDPHPPAGMPTRRLGRTDLDVSILTLGAGQPPSHRLLNAGWDAGIRCIDTAASYGRGSSEKVIGEWLAEQKDRAKVRIISKDRPDRPEKWARCVDRSLAALEVDCIDVYLIHSLGKRGIGEDQRRDCEIPKLKGWGEAADKLKKAGKVRAVGFTTHAEIPIRTALLRNAAEGGWVDAIMVSYDPKLVRENKEYDQAIEACHKAGVGLICMKEMRAVSDMPKLLPEFKELGLTAHQAVLQAVWTDERITTVTSAMPNLGIVRENSAAALGFKPLEGAKLGAVIGLYDRYGRRFCNACDGGCRRAGNTDAALNDITRALCYAECDNQPDAARRIFASLTPEQRDWRGADLAAASVACKSNLDFATLLARAESTLASHSRL